MNFCKKNALRLRVKHQNSIVFDTSALLAYLFGEQGEDVVAEHLNRGIINTVTATELVTKLVRYGMDSDTASETLRSLSVEIRPYTLAVAEKAGSMVAFTHDYGISLGDRACLAFAESLSLPVLTSDREWQKIQQFVTVSIQFIR
jgi:ribonuclease VapC